MQVSKLNKCNHPTRLLGVFARPSDHISIRWRILSMITPRAIDEIKQASLHQKDNRLRIILI